MTCPNCGEGIVAGDAFCEACGGELVPGGESVPGGELVPGVGVGASASTPGHDRTHLLQPGPGTGVDTSLPCVACGAAVDDDGFCSVCGQRARTRREHWTETHGTAPGIRIGAVCDKGVEHARNEDAMATTITAGGRAVVVVCDGVTTAPDSDRASLAASAAACEVLAAAPPSAGSFAALGERVGAGARRRLSCRER